MKIKDEVLNKGGKVAYKLDAGDGRFTVSEMPAEVAAEIIAKGKKGEEVNGYMCIDGRHFFPVNAIDFGDEAKDEKPESEAPSKIDKPETAATDKSVKKG